MSTTTAEIDRSKLAPAGIEGYLHVLDDNAGPRDADRDMARLRDVSERDFDVGAALGKHASASASIQASVSEGEGESFILLPRGKKEVPLGTPKGCFRLVANERGELGTVFHRCKARSSSDAIGIFVTGLTPMLDALSFDAGVPVVVQRVCCRDEKNRLSVVSYRTPYPTVIVQPYARNIFDEMLPVYALFREALSTPSNYYRFLCYYKIMEGIFRDLRPRLMAEARSRGIQLVPRRELVPAHAELAFTHKEYIGKPIQPLFEGEFTDRYRDTVAHFVLKERAVLNINDPAWSGAFADVILLADLCAREVMHRQQDYYEQFQRVRRQSVARL